MKAGGTFRTKNQRGKTSSQLKTSSLFAKAGAKVTPRTLSARFSLFQRKTGLEGVNIWFFAVSFMIFAGAIYVPVTQLP